MSAWAKHLSVGAKLRKRMNDAYDKATLGRVVDVLRTKRDLLCKVERDLINDGHLEPIENPSFSPRDKSQLALLDRGDDDDGPALPASCSGAAASSADRTPTGRFDHFEELPFDRYHSTFEALGVKLLMRVLEIVEPVSCSAGNISRMRERGQRLVSKASVLQLVEYGFRIRRADTIDNGMRNARATARYLVERYEAEPKKRLHDVRLPINWEDNREGWYALGGLQTDGKLQIKHRFAKTLAYIDAPPKDAKLYIQNNFCEADAAGARGGFGVRV